MDESRPSGARSLGLLSRTVRFGSFLGAAVVLFHAATARTAHPLAPLLGLGLLAPSLLVGFSAARPLAAPASSAGAQREQVLLAVQVSIAVQLAILLGPGKLDGALAPLSYITLVLVAGAAGWLPACAALAVFLAVEAVFARHSLARGAAFFRGPMLVSAVLLGRGIVYARLLEARASARLEVQSELERLRALARSYRLFEAAVRPMPSATPYPPGVSADTETSEERLLHAGVEEIQHAVRLALALLCDSLGLHTALLLGVDSATETVHTIGASSQCPTLLFGPFSQRAGIFAASLLKLEQIELLDPKATSNLPYYRDDPPIGALCITPLVEHGRAQALLVVDRVLSSPFTNSDAQLLRHAASFLLRAIGNERLFVELRRAQTEQSKLYRGVNALSGATSEAQVIDAGVSGAREFAAFDFAAATLYDPELEEHEICAVSGEGADSLRGQRFKHNSGLVSMVVELCHALPYRDGFDVEHQVVFTRGCEPPPLASLIVLPLVVHNAALGTLVLGSRQRGAFSETVRPTLEVMARHIAVSLANARMLTRLEELATRDGLTGLFNKRALSELAGHKLKSAARFQKPLTVLICDIDHFKKVNDTYGHDIGDLVLRGFSDVLKRVKRDTDALGRFGGEEFVVICEETDERGGLQLAERIRAELEQAAFHTPFGPLNVTCSVGVAPFPSAGRTWDALFKASDEALYASKRGGRNRVTAWSTKREGCAA